ncbi:MAG: RcnB family protein [Deltaproteobacteria bacterium]|nr:RcnB family protein [Deltaproteobacteria bacterium]
MRKITLRKNLTLTLAVTAILATSGPALADRPPWAGGGGKNEKHERKERRERHEDHRDRDRDERHSGHGDRDNVTVNVYFGDQHRAVIRDYYAEQFRSGHCPPGLVKKGNGCVPPGQARKWAVGRPLPREVIFHELPPAVIVQLGPPPPNHRYVRVATDILLIAVGTGMVVDALADLAGN